MAADFERRGVRLGVLRALREMARARAPEPGPPRTHRAWEQPPSARGAGEPLSTEDVCFELIRPLTRVARCSYVELLARGHGGQAADAPAADGTPTVVGSAGDLGRATRFVSHAWGLAFGSLVEALEAAAEAAGSADAAEAFWWLDLVTNSQWDTATRPFEWWSAVFQTNVHAIGTTVLVLEPWHAPLALTRAWCLFEINATVESGAALSVAMPRSARRAFETALVDDFDSIAAALSRVDVERSAASSATDRRSICEAVQAGVGFHELNVAVGAALREWLGGCGRRALRELEASGSPARPLKLRHKLAVLLRRLGHAAEAERLYRAELAAREASPELGPGHPDTLATANNLAVLLKARGPAHRAEAEALYSRAVAGKEARLGAEHPSTLTSVENLAILRAEGAPLGETEALYRRVLDGRVRQLGAEAPETLRTLHNLTVLHAERGSLLEAEQLARRTVAQKEAAAGLGANHPSTLESRGALARILLTRGACAEAEALARRNLSALERVHGPAHKLTLAGRELVARALAGSAEPRALAEAEAILRDTLRARAEGPREAAPAGAGAAPPPGEEGAGAHGADGGAGAEDTRRYATMGALCAVLAQSGRALAEAEGLARAVLAGREASLGAEAPDTVDTLDTLGSVLCAQGDARAAAELHARAADGLERAGRDRRAAFARANLGLALMACGDPEGARVAREAARALEAEHHLLPEHRKLRQVRDEIGAGIDSAAPPPKAL